MKLRKLEILKRKKKGVECKIIFEEKKDGLHVTDTEQEIQENIGNFFLNLVKEDINYTNDKDNFKTKYLFDIFYIHPKSKNIIKASTQFYYIKGESITQKIENRLPRNVILNSTNKQSLEYFKIYIRELIKRGTKDNMHLLINNEEVKEQVKKYIIHFMELIDGKENKYIEYSYYYNILYPNPNHIFYNTYNISSNQDIFLLSYSHPEIYSNWFKEYYEKIGFIEIKEPVYLYIHLPSLKKLMEKERYTQKMTTQMLNIGLRKLGLIALDEGKNTINLKKNNGDSNISMNLTRLRLDKLKELYMDAQKNFTHEIFSNLDKPTNIEKPINKPKRVVLDSKTNYNPKRTHKIKKNFQSKQENSLHAPNGEHITTTHSFLLFENEDYLKTLNYDTTKIKEKPTTKTIRENFEDGLNSEIINKMNIFKKCLLSIENKEPLTENKEQLAEYKEQQYKILFKSFMT